MGGPGVARFDEPYLLDYSWIDGHFIRTPPVEAVLSTPGVRALGTHGGTHKLQRRFRDLNRPENYSCYIFTFTALANDESSWDGIRDAESKGGWVYYTYGSRRTDTFPAVNGETYRLTRDLASSVVTGVTTSTHPSIVKLNGSVDPTAATVTGRSVLAAETGVISVTYTPVHRVIFKTGLGENVSGHNRVDSQIVLEEVLVP